MTDLTGDVPTCTLMVLCGTVLLMAGKPFGQGLITLAVGLHVGHSAK